METEAAESSNLRTQYQHQYAGCCAEGVKTRLNPKLVQQLSADLRALAHPVRLQILDILSHNAGRVCVCDLAAALPVKQPTISHHLKRLRAAGLIECECRGQWAYYFVRREALAQLRVRITALLEELA